MLLAIDIGNTNIVFAVFDGADIVQRFRVETRTPEYPNFSAFEITRIFIASVVPEVEASLTAFCEEQLHVTPVFVSKENAGIDVRLDRPEEVGADRLVNAVAVAHYYQAPAIVVDFGTATTFDVVLVDGAYAGGVIAPGIRLSLQALEEAAAKLPDIDIEKPDHVIGANTVHAMQSGIYYGYQGLIRNIVARIAEEMGADVFVLATGGLAPFFAKDSDVIDAVDQDLTLKGLQVIDAANVR